LKKVRFGMPASEVSVIIVAAGRGSRMQELTSERPKSLISFAGRPLLEWQLASLFACGLKDVTIVGGYLAEQLDQFGGRMIVNPAWQKTNMVYSLMCAEEVFLSGNTIVVAYADIIYERRVLESLLSCDADAATVVDSNWLALWRMRAENPLQDAETLRLADDGTILEIGQRPSSLDQIEGQYIGLSKFTPRGAAAFSRSFREIDRHRPGKAAETCYFTDVLQAMVDTGTPLRAAFTEGGWLEFDTEEDLAAYESRLADNALDEFWAPARGNAR
jgi:choline kinase